MELNHTGGTYDNNRKPTPFLFLELKMLQIQLDKDIVVSLSKSSITIMCGFQGPSTCASLGTVAKICQ
uniref:Pre-mRNA-splicing factor 38 n=1 Tax=Arundo donax TaxID=35708 RepID=A0A0A9AIR0_ARUDO